MFRTDIKFYIRICRESKIGTMCGGSRGNDETEKKK